MKARMYSLRKPKWKVLIQRRSNPEREILVFANTQQEAIESAFLTARETYGIWDAKSFGVPVRQ